jgi:hypothetical protein
MTVHYINTDLDLVSQSDLTALAAALEAQGFLALHVGHGPDLRWRGCLETDVQYTGPEPNISAMVDAIENLNPSILRDWQGCCFREFNIGYASGCGPGQIANRLSVPLLARLAKLKASAGIAVYAIQDT